MKVQFCHHGIGVENMEESIDWYRRMFDAQVIFDQHSSEFGAPLNCRVVIMQADEVQFELFEYLGEDRQLVPPVCRDSVTDLRMCGNKHDCFNVDLVDFVYNRVLPNNVFINFGPNRQDDNWQLFILDPNGIVIELYDIGGAKRNPHAFDDFPCKLHN